MIEDLNVPGADMVPLEQSSAHKIDKSDWGDGKWQEEPDELIWKDEETGLTCIIIRTEIGHLCGYVGVGNDHVWYGKSYDEPVPLPPDFETRTYTRDAAPIIPLFTMSQEMIDEGKITMELYFNVHGGLTWSRHADELARLAIDEDLWTFGFDCGHSDDLAPGASTLRSFPDYNEGKTYKDLEYVKENVERLASQLKYVSEHLSDE